MPEPQNPEGTADERPPVADELAARREEHDRQRRLVVASLLACPPTSRSA